MNVCLWVRKIANNPRMERKYFTSFDQGFILDQYILNSPAKFKEIYYQRRVNNVYFDDHDFSFLKDNLIGASERIKFRHRWYQDKKQQTNLELKHKLNNVGFKYVTRSTKVPDELITLIKNLKPSLFNTYLRQYFLSADKKVRLTIDSQMEYQPLRGVLSRKFKSERTVIEIKYHPDDEKQAVTVANSLPFSLQKNSKYVNGLSFGFF